MGVLAFPFDIAANRIGHRYCYGSTREKFLQSSVQIVDRYLGRIAWIIYSSTGVNELCLHCFQERF